MYSLGLINGKIYLDGEFTNKDIYVQDEKIAEIVPRGETRSCQEIVNCSQKLIMPGFIDPHVHINLDLGEFQSSDDYASASKTAAFGGVTTFIDFLEPIKSAEELNSMFEKKITEAQHSYIDYSFHTTVGNYTGDVNKLVKTTVKKGLSSIKLFTTYSKSDRQCSYGKIREFLSASSQTGILILVHAENEAIISKINVPDKIEFYASSRPPRAEIKEIEKLVQMVEEIEGKIYFVHVTCGTSIELLKEKYSKFLGNKIFVESCPQYFHLTKEQYQGEKGFLFLLAPPLRPIDEKEKLHENIDYISAIGTDHCPFTKEEKLHYESPNKAPKGFGGLEFSFSLMYSLFGNSIIDKFTIQPAIIHNLFPKKGIIRVNSDADLVIFDPNKQHIIKNDHSNSDYSVYEGIKVTGMVESTILRGEFLVRDRQFIVSKKSGQFIKRQLN